MLLAWHARGRLGRALSAPSPSPLLRVCGVAHLLLALPRLCPPDLGAQESEEVDMKPIVVMDVATFLYIKTNNLYSTRPLLRLAALARLLCFRSEHLAAGGCGHTVGLLGA